ncbi:hypothetical protein PtrSN002B_003573 [Pyrenophora tritici-repentis]|uniref:Retinal domain containing protein n=1 Tax=Pyrenophora tritici-repentis TaxID=45151 RepID=A0A2W1GP40_9PLEO|nr:Retinal domain-containing protein [Pyrenophora tritici-repentis]KAF7450700.1 Retinal domain containing protein [Pyrenophora tritici-repentis]KAF7573339.1 Treacle multi-domain protein [Pyrenophora tritici-repentis]KAG9381083.1 Retinal domain containing protein [Pyrenophora tritici-repentis]KAI0580411.1 Retinal domain-containing protein [Pyrenophora tritici-repentis]
MVDAQDAGSKLFSKSRWKTKIFEKTAEIAAANQAKTARTPDDDLDAFLKPSTDRVAQQQKEAAAAALFSRPRIDVASAQRWPSAQVILANAAAKSPGPGGLKTGTRKKGLTVGFVRSVPEVIGHGGDECEDPTIEVSQNKKAATASQVEKPPVLVPQDDANVTARSNGIGRTASQTEYRTQLTRTHTNPGELSPPLGQKMQIGQINSTAQLPPTPPRYMGSMGLGERPKPLSRAPTGFDSIMEAVGNAPGRRQSEDSVYSQDSDNLSPTISRNVSVREPTIQEEDVIQPKMLKRTQTGFSTLGDDDAHEPVHPIPSVPHLPEQRLAEQEEDGPNSFAARVKQRMRSEEGRTLHEAAQRAAETERRDSESSSQLSMAGTPPSSYRTPATARTPHESSQVESRGSPRPMDPEDPHRSRATQGRRPMGHAIQTDMEPRSPSVASSQYAPFSPLSQTRTSPPVRSEPFSAGLQQMTSPSKEPSFQPVDIGSNPPTPPQIAQQELFFEAAQPPPSFSTPQIRAISGPSGSELPSRNASGASMKPATSLARSDTKTLNEVAYQDFAERVTHMRGIFQLTAQLGGNIHSHSPMQWLRVATWWFLKGRTGMENMIRSQPRNGEPPQERLAQPHVDLAKVWWIITEVLPNHPGLQSYGDASPNAQVDLARQAGDAASAEAYDIQNALSHYMKLLVGSMKKHQSMPPTQALIQGQDQSIWEEYPTFPGDATSVLGQPSQGGPQFSLSQCIPLADTKNDFCYFRMFVKASLSTDDPSTDRVPMNAVMSVLRSKNEYQVKLSICSQNSLINVQVGSGSAIGWKDVNWKQQSQQITVQLRHGFLLTLALHEVDFRSLWSIINHTNRVESDIRERKDERFASKIYLREASYRDPASPGAFAPDRVKDCKLLVFQKIERSSEGTGKRKLHRGYRMVLVTPQHVKQVSVINHEFGTKNEPMNFEYVTEPDQAPALRLRFREEGPDKKLRVCTAHLVFHDSRERNDIFGTFTSMNVAEGETTFAQVSLKAYHIESADQAEGFSQQGSRVLERLQWVEAKVVNQDPEAAGLESAPTVMSESLRIMCRHTAGIVCDRMNLGPGELLVRLPVDGSPELTLLREAQQDLSVAVDASRTEPNVPDALAELLKTLTSATTIRRLTFNSYQDLHTFQLAVTGFNVKFDGLACTFSISRRRMVVPIYKQWTANRLRLQIVEQDNIVQLLAFFEDFSHADAMNFQLRTMDTFEKTDKGGKFGLKLVDAKFALPVDERRGEGKIQKAEGRLTGWSGTKRRFVCLDEIEYPGEHDDILIMFDSAETRDRFAEALPAATMERKFTVRRKI